MELLVIRLLFIWSGCRQHPIQINTLIDLALIINACWKWNGWIGIRKAINGWLLMWNWYKNNDGYLNKQLTYEKITYKQFKTSKY